MATIVQVAENKKCSVSEVYLNQTCDEIRSNSPEIYIIKAIPVQNNKFLHAAYQLQKAKFELSREFQCRTVNMFHATAENNVQSILKDNLDWRRVKRSRFGEGVSFSDSPKYANKFCNNKIGVHRAFIVCEILLGRELIVDAMNGTCNRSLCPGEGVDTYRSRSRFVVVKFDDDTFYPICVIYYQTSVPRPNRPLGNFSTKRIPTSENFSTIGIPTTGNFSTSVIPTSRNFSTKRIPRNYPIDRYAGDELWLVGLFMGLLCILVLVVWAFHQIKKYF